MADDVLKIFAEGQVDARSLSEFMFKPADFMVTRRLAPSINTLNFHIDRLYRTASEGEIAVSSFKTKSTQAIKDAQKKAGYVIVGSFANGATLINYNDIVTDANGNLFRWGGSLPKVVAASSTPEITGGYAKSAWVEVGSSLIREDLEALRSGVTQYHYTQMGKAFDSSEGVNDVSASWTHGNIGYDETTDNFIVFYNTNSGHAIAQCSVLMRTKDATSDFFSEPTVVASEKGVYSYKSQSGGIAPNGDYIAIVARFPWNKNSSDATYIYRSTDKGQTFTRTQISVSGTPLTVFNGDASGFLVTQSGRVLFMGLSPSNQATRIFYSDDNCVTWQQSSIATNPLYVTEPAWCDIGNNRLVCIARAAISGGTESSIPAKFMTSADNGLTWTAPVNSASITNLTVSNGELIPDYEQKIVEFIHHSRQRDEDNYCSLLRSWATFDEAWIDEFEPQVRVGKMAAYVGDGRERGDSGYVGAKKNKDGIINAFYYTGTYAGAQINYVIGLPNTSYERGFEIDYNTGLRSDSTPKGRIERSFDTHIYKNGDINPQMPLSFVSRSAVLFNTPSGIVFNSTTVGRFSFGSSTPVDISKADSISVYIDSYNATGAGVDNSGIILQMHSDSNTGILSNRVLIADIKSQGWHTFDVSKLEGDVWINPVLLVAVDTSLSVRLTEIVLTGSDLPTAFELQDHNTYWDSGYGFLAKNKVVETKISPDEDLTSILDDKSNLLRFSVAKVSGAPNVSSRITFQDAIPLGSNYLTVSLRTKGVYAGNSVTNLMIVDTLNPTVKEQGYVLKERTKDSENVITFDLSSIDLNNPHYFAVEITDQALIEPIDIFISKVYVC